MYFAGLDLLKLKEYFDISLFDSDYVRYVYFICYLKLIDYFLSDLETWLFYL